MASRAENLQQLMGFFRINGTETGGTRRTVAALQIAQPPLVQRPESSFAAATQAPEGNSASQAPLADEGNGADHDFKQWV